MEPTRRWHDRFPTPEKIRPSFESYKKWLATREMITPAVAEKIEFAETILKRGCLIFYIAGALTEATEKDKDRYVKTAELCDARGMFGYAPHLYGTDPKKHPDVTPEEIRNIDFLFGAVLPNVHINFLFPIAHGNAIEQGWAEVFHIPSIYLAPRTMRLSRLTRGMLNIYATILYDDIDEVYNELGRYLNGLIPVVREVEGKVVLDI